jgi:hypothetical protein
MSNEQRLAVDERAKFIAGIDDKLKKSLEQLLSRTDLPLVSFFVQSGVTATGPEACFGEEGECLVVRTALRGPTGYTAISDFSAVVVKQGDQLVVTRSTICGLFEAAQEVCPTPEAP